MKPHQLPEELDAVVYMHPLLLMEKWNLSYPQLSEATGIDETTLRRYNFPDYSKNRRTPYRNKVALRVARVLDELWSNTGCPYRSEAVA